MNESRFGQLLAIEGLLGVSEAVSEELQGTREPNLRVRYDASLCKHAVEMVHSTCFKVKLSNGLKI